MFQQSTKFMSALRNNTMQIPGWFNKQTTEVKSVVCCSFFPSICPNISSSFLSLPHQTIAEIQTYVQSKQRLPSSHSFSLSAAEDYSVPECLEWWSLQRGEPHFRILGDKGRQSASRGLTQLPVAYCGTNRKVTANSHKLVSTVSCTSRKNTLYNLPHLEGHLSFQNNAEIAFIKLSTWSQFCYCPLFKYSSKIITKKQILNVIPTYRHNTLFYLKVSLM